jgi:hypothetical protein
MPVLQNAEFSTLPSFIKPYDQIFRLCFSQIYIYTPKCRHAQQNLIYKLANFVMHDSVLEYIYPYDQDMFPFCYIHCSDKSFHKPGSGHMHNVLFCLRGAIMLLLNTAVAALHTITAVAPWLLHSITFIH